MKLPKELTRKAGPLPVYGWALLAVAAGFLYLRGRGATAATPVLPAASSGAQQPASGQGNPADNSSGDLLDALGANADAANALLAAVQAAGYGGGYGSVTGGGSSSGGGGSVSTATVTAPAVTDNSVPSDPASQAAVAAAGDQPVTGYLAPSPDAGYVIDPATGQVYTGSSSIEGGLRQRVGQPYQPDALSRYLGNTIGYDPAVSAGPAAAPVTAHLESAPTVVQPAPVDTTSATVAPGGRATIVKPVAS